MSAVCYLLAIALLGDRGAAFFPADCKEVLLMGLASCL
jgi:hypothetical protein